MKSFMSLSIFMMKNLKYKYKFGLILFVFTFILFVLSLIITNSYNVQIVKIEKEIEGVKYNKAMVHLLYQITEHKSLLYKDIKEDDSESKNKLKMLNNKLDNTYELIKSFDERMGDPLLNAQRKYVKKGKTKTQSGLVLLKEYLDKAKSKVEKRSFGNNTKYHDFVKDQIIASFLDINYVSKLVSDDEPGTSYLIDIAYDVIPNLLISMSSASELAYEFAFEQYSTESQKQVLTAYIADLKKYSERLSDTIERIKKEDSTIENKISDDYKRVKSNIDILIKKIDEEIIKAYDIEEDSATFYKLLNRSRESVKNLLDLNINLLDSDLKKRLNDYKFRSGVVIALIVTSILLSLYLFIGLFLIVQGAINNIKKSAELMAQGDFRANIDVQTKDELGELAHSLNKTTDSLKSLISEVFASSSELDEGSGAILESASQSAIGAQQVAQSIEQLVVGIQDQSKNVQICFDRINEINSVIRKISDTASHSVDLSRSTERNADEGYSRSKAAVDVINQIKDSSLETAEVINELNGLSVNIGKIVEMIKTIASQTDLLALNAAIEAARAGEQGKGFAVVADEVKKLATQSAEASDNITNMILQVQDKTNNAVDIITLSVSNVDEGVSIIEDTGNMLHDILTAAKASGDKIEGISNEVVSLAKSSDEIVDMIDNISGFTEQSAAGAQEISAVTEEQSANAQEIKLNINNLVNVISKLVKSSSVFKIK